MSWLMERIYDALEWSVRNDKMPAEYLNSKSTDMNSNQIKAIQEKIGTTPDGFWGPKSILAAERHLVRMMPASPQWPATGQASLTAFYGNAGDENKLVNLDVSDIEVRYDGSKVRTIRCHAKVAESLKRVMVKLSHSHPEILRDYNGCFNDRPMRGGSLPSLHARGAAIDFCASENGNITHWPARATMPFEVMEEFAREGWIAAGAFWGRDAMHFQATK